MFGSDLQIIGLAVSAVTVILVASLLLVKHLRRQRQRQEFRNFFGFLPASYPDQEERRLVDRRLGDYARNMRQAFNDQEAARRRFRHGDIKKQRLEEADTQTKFAKSQFWRAHGLAASFEFDVKESYLDYQDVW